MTRLVFRRKPHGRPPAPSASLELSFTVQNDSVSTASGQKVSFGVGFAKGRIPAGKKLEARRSNGLAFTRQQVDALNTWEDGSLSFAVVSYEQQDDIAGSGTDTISLYSADSSAANNNSAHAIADIRALNYTVEWVAASTTYTLNTQDAIDAGQYRITKVGPAMIEARIWGRFFNAGTPHAYMFGLIWVGLMRDGTTAYAMTRLANTWSNNYSSRTSDDVDSTTSWVLKKAGSAVKTVTMTQDVGDLESSYICNDDVTPIWSANAPTLRVIHDHLQQGTAKLIPYMPVTQGIKDAIDGSPTAQNYVPFNRFDLPADLDSTGAGPNIGYISYWSANYAFKQTALTARKNRMNAAAQAVIRKNIWSTSYGEVSVTRTETYGSIVGNNALNLLGAGTSPITDNGNAVATITGNNVYHWPWAAYYAYLCDGDSWWIEDALQDANHACAQTNDGAREVTHGNGDNQKSVIRRDGGPRGFAWGIRNIACSKRVCPDAHPLHDYIDDLHADQIGYMNSICKAANMVDEAEALGIPTTLVEKTGGAWQTQWFMWGYLAIVTAMEALRDYLTGASEWVSIAVEKCILGASVDGCTYNTSDQTLNFTHQNGAGGLNSDLAQTWANVGHGLNTFPTWNDTTKLIPSTGCPASGTLAVYDGGHSYPAIWHGGAELWQQFGSSKAATFANYMDTEETNQAPTNAEWAGNPQWYIRKAI